MICIVMDRLTDTCTQNGCQYFSVEVACPFSLVYILLSIHYYSRYRDSTHITHTVQLKQQHIHIHIILSMTHLYYDVHAQDNHYPHCTITHTSLGSHLLHAGARWSSGQDHFQSNIPSGTFQHYCCTNSISTSQQRSTTTCLSGDHRNQRTGNCKHSQWSWQYHSKTTFCSFY